MPHWCPSSPLSPSQRKKSSLPTVSNRNHQRYFHLARLDQCPSLRDNLHAQDQPLGHLAHLPLAKHHPLLHHQQ